MKTLEDEREALCQMDPQSTFPIDANNSIINKIIEDFKHCGIVTQTVNDVDNYSWGR